MKPSIPKRVGILFGVYFVCSISAVYFCRAPCSKLLLWLGVHLGPFTAFTTASGPTTFDEWMSWLLMVGIDIICIPAYLVRPNVVTIIISFLGMAGWFYLAVMGIESAV